MTWHRGQDHDGLMEGFTNQQQSIHSGERMLDKTIELGDRVRDRISKLEGIVTARTEFLHGCIRISVQPEGTGKDGKPADHFVVDEPQAVLVKKAVYKPQAVGNPRPVAAQPRRHGPRDDFFQRQSGPSR